MSTPENKSATPENQAQEQAEPTLEEQLETERKRRKDTQAAYTKGQQQLKAIEAERDKLVELLSGTVAPVIPAEDKERLENLKFDDPEAWRKEITALENKAISESREKIANLTGEAKSSAERQFELDRRQQVLEEFNASAEVQITDEIIADEVPPRITKKLEEGKISFEEFLDEVATYLGKSKVVKNEDTLNQPNISSLGGKNTPSTAKANESLAAQYAKDVY